MWFVLLISVISAGALFAGILGCANQSRSVSGNTNLVPVDTIKGLFSKQQIREKLEVLANSPAPDKLQPGAMCYKVAAPPNRVEYICPVCGERTLYTDSEARFVDREIPVCRSLADSISGIDLVLDEKSYCKKCSKESKEPELCIHIKFAGDTTETKVCNINSDDMQLLYEFTKGKFVHKDDYDNETPLKDYTKRLYELLGIKEK